jgi:hypothetical protein
MSYKCSVVRPWWYRVYQVEQAPFDCRKYGQAQAEANTARGIVG